jgi:hypothetical protein
MRNAFDKRLQRIRVIDARDWVVTMATRDRRAPNLARHIAGRPEQVTAFRNEVARAGAVIRQRRRADLP